MADKEHDQGSEKKPETAAKETETRETSASVDAILKERLRLEQQQAELDQMLKEKFQKNITVMFTDIKGSTSFFETYGDVEGRAMVERHNAILFPKIEQHGGRIIKTIGDAIMATFDDPAAGVKAAIAMQQALKEYNQKQEQKHKRILVRIGLNYGPAVVEEKDVFGDAVNVAARVESQADAEQILISEELYKEVRNDEEILVRFFGEVPVKGKAEPVKLYRVLWSEEQLIEEAEFKKAATRRTVDKRGLVHKGKVVEVVVSRDEKTMKLSVFERQRGEEKTVSQYDVVKIDDNLIKNQCQEVVNLLNRANKRGKITKEILKQLQAAGQILFDHLFSPSAKEKILHSQAEHLIVRMDDRLVHIPWELLFDGKMFFCQRFAMGRIVATRQQVAESATRHVAKPLRMLVAVDPRSDLPAARQEGIHIRDELDREHEFVNVNLKAGEISVNYIKSKIRDYDIIHYAGHAEYNSENPADSGWLLADGKLTADEIKNMTGRKPMPALVFANACQSGQTEEWQIRADYEKDIFGLANAFLVSGVQHYIGTFWDILDEPGHDFALAFYEETIAGASIGEAVRRARLKLMDKYGEETIVWASYMLYGDPTFSYLAEVAEAEEAETREPAAPPAPDGQPAYAAAPPAVMRGAESAALPRPAGMSKTTLGLIAGAVIAVIVLGVLLLRGGGNISIHIQAGQSALEQGDFQKAVAEFKKAAQAGDEELARQALAKMAAAYNQMGLDLSQKGEVQEALKAYQEALKADPRNAQAAINLGQKYLAMGKPAEAKKAFERALAADPGNRVAETMLAQAAAMLASIQDAQKQAEVNRLVSELAEKWRSGKITPPKSAGDEWTSRPVTITFLDFNQKGRMAMEGEMEFLRLALAQALRDTGRVEVVEREKIDRIISELNLASSDLANEETRLRLGRLFGARLIATGSFIRHRDEAQVNLRLIETETTLAPVAISEVFDGDASPEQIAQAVAEKLVDAIVKEYPLRGKVIEVKGNEVKLNIGSLTGVKEGMKMDILDDDELKIGKLEITSAGPKVSAGRILEKTGKVSPGTKVKEARD